MPEGVQYEMQYALALGDESALGDLSCSRSNNLCGLVVNVQCGSNAAIDAVITSVCNKGSGTCGVDLVGNAWDAATAGASPGIEDCTVTLTDGKPIAGGSTVCAQRPSAVSGNSQWYTSVGMFNTGKAVVSATLSGISGKFNGDSNYLDFQASGGRTFGADADLTMTFQDGTSQTLKYGDCTSATSTHIFGGSNLRLQAETESQGVSQHARTHLAADVAVSGAAGLLLLVAVVLGARQRNKQMTTATETTTPTPEAASAGGML